jgi:hypothetical protein
LPPPFFDGKSGVDSRKLSLTGGSQSPERRIIVSNDKYSTILACLFDQAGPAIVNGGNPSYSIFRVTQARDQIGQRVDRMTVHDLAIIWDDDHDERVVYALERLHLAGLLWPVVFASENRGTLTMFIQGGLSLPSNFEEEVREACSAAVKDNWHVTFPIYNRPSPFNFNPGLDVVPGASLNAISYLCAIDAQWKLGLREKPLVDLKSIWHNVGPEGILAM